ncbi:MAG: hypothetical protein IPM84_03430 [Anaerolineae bacterium]|nr:hypothetical protein [Anaerolineae bacterium]
MPGDEIRGTMIPRKGRKMNSGVLAVVNEVTFEQVVLLAQRLRPVDQARLVVRLAPKVEWLLMKIESISSPPSRIPLRGLWSDLGTAPSAEDIDQVQQEMWSTFAESEA